jgi:hypothetical protein
MSRIATLAAVLTMVVAPAAFAGPADLRAPDQQVARQPKPIDLRAPDSRVVFTRPVAQIDLRSPDAVSPMVAAGHNLSPTAAAQPASSDDGFNWGILGIVVAALAACGVLAVMLRRHLDVGRALGA